MDTAPTRPQREPKGRPTTPPRVVDVPRLPVDGRTRTARRWRTIYHELSRACIGVRSTAREALIRRAATLAVACEQLDVDLAAGRTVDPDTLVRLTNALARCLASLGLATWTDAPDRPDPEAALARLHRRYDP